MSLSFSPEYPLQRSLKYGISVNRFLDGSQQNYATSQALNRFSLSLTQLTQSQRDAFISSFNSAKGRWDNNLSFILNSITYSDLRFDSDQQASTESSPLYYNSSFDLVQTSPGALNTNPSPPTSWASYPVLNSPFQLPYKPSINFVTSITQLDSGPSYTWSFPANHTTPVSATYLPIFYLSYQSISDTDLNTLEQFYNYVQGPVCFFSFTDPDTTYATPITYPKCHFLNLSLDITYNEPNSSSVSVVIEAANN